MPLDFGNSGGGAFIRFKASINSWEKSGEGGAQEFTWTAPAIMDVENIQLGWLLLKEGQRDWQPWVGNKPTPQPGEDYKRGFSMQVFSKTLFGEDDAVREFCTSASGCVEFAKELYNACEANFKKGQVPVVNITGSRAVKIGKGTTRVPTFDVVKWVGRPAELQADSDDDLPSFSPTSPAKVNSPEPAVTASAAAATAPADEF